ncbi:MAG TPA: hypothetical protein VFK41_01745 [Nocardioidaceae bacterium]|nr:hypothetical protein [Nocardioidaceae bacterium]
MTQNPLLVLVAAALATLSLAGCQASEDPASAQAPTVSSPSPDVDDPSTWLPFESTRYGFTIAYPPGWEATPANGTWTFPQDTAWPEGVERGDWFYLDGADGAVAASAWSVALETGVSADEWFLAYCKVEVTPCDGTEPKVRASLDGHAGWLVRSSDPQAYFEVGDRIYLVVVWQPPDHPALEPYGGGHELVESLVSTMRVLPSEESQSETPDVVTRWLDSSTWVPFRSDRYGFMIGHPDSWTVVEADHVWDQATDSINNDSGGMEVFVPPDDTVSIYLAAWATEVSTGTTLGEWAQAFCEQYVATCTDVQEMSEPARTTASGEDGVLLLWDDGIVAFHPSWYDGSDGRAIWEQPAPTDGRVYLVESGRPATGPYYARELIDLFTASLCVGCEG